LRTSPTICNFKNIEINKKGGERNGPFGQLCWDAPSNIAGVKQQQQQQQINDMKDWSSAHLADALQSFEVILGLLVLLGLLPQLLPH